MRRDLLINRHAALAAVALLLAATISCNDIGDDGDLAEAVPLVTAIATAGLSVSTPGDVVASLTVVLEDRTGSATSFFNDVNFKDYEVTYSPTAIVPDIAGSFNTTYCQAGASCTLLITMVTDADKGGVAAGTVVFGDVHVKGEDVTGRPVSFHATVALAFEA